MPQPVCNEDRTCQIASEVPFARITRRTARRGIASRMTTLASERIAGAISSTFSENELSLLQQISQYAPFSSAGVQQRCMKICTFFV
jgi:hypothetical protein